jgi:hypothetical protein
METTEKTKERVRENSTDEQNKNIDDKTYENIRQYSHKGKARIAARLDELEEEWDIERLLEMNASGLALTGIILGVLVDKRWFILPGIVTSFLLLHAIQGWCPPVPLLRKLGFRTRDEINREKYALKAIKGDFKNIRTADAAWNASE